MSPDKLFKKIWILLLKKAQEALQQEGADNEVTAYFENSYFPMKSYGDITFPPGEYEGISY